MYEVEYKVSTYPSKFAGYQSKNKNNGTITLYISTIWNMMSSRKSVYDRKKKAYRLAYETNEKKSYERFIIDLISIILIERVCLERGFQKIRMKNRCNPYCKMLRYGQKMSEWAQ